MTRSILGPDLLRRTRPLFPLYLVNFPLRNCSTSNPQTTPSSALYSETKHFKNEMSGVFIGLAIIAAELAVDTALLSFASPGGEQLEALVDSGLVIGGLLFVDLKQFLKVPLFLHGRLVPQPLLIFRSAEVCFS